MLPVRFNVNLQLNSNSVPVWIGKIRFDKTNVIYDGVQTDGQWKARLSFEIITAMHIYFSCN